MSLLMSFTFINCKIRRELLYTNITYNAPEILNSVILKLESFGLCFIVVW